MNNFNCIKLILIKPQHMIALVILKSARLILAYKISSPLSNKIVFTKITGIAIYLAWQH